VDRGWRELVDGEEMKLRVGVLQGLELGFLGAAATVIDCHIDSPPHMTLKKSNFLLFHCVSRTLLHALASKSVCKSKQSK
jgi:hypothetical protein